MKKHEDPLEIGQMDLVISKMHASVEIGADILSIAGIANTRTVSLFLSRISRHLKYGMRTRAHLQQQKGHIGYSIQR